MRNVVLEDLQCYSGLPSVWHLCQIVFHSYFSTKTFYFSFLRCPSSIRSVAKRRRPASPPVIYFIHRRYFWRCRINACRPFAKFRLRLRHRRWLRSCRGITFAPTIATPPRVRRIVWMLRMCTERTIRLRRQPSQPADFLVILSLTRIRLVLYSFWLRVTVKVGGGFKERTNFNFGSEKCRSQGWFQTRKFGSSSSSVQFGAKLRVVFGAISEDAPSMVKIFHLGRRQSWLWS